MKEPEFRCGWCGNTYPLFTDGSWTDQDAKAELEEKFPGVPASDCEVVCDKCYKELMGEKA